MGVKSDIVHFRETSEDRKIKLQSQCPHERTKTVCSFCRMSVSARNGCKHLFYVRRCKNKACNAVLGSEHTEGKRSKEYVL